MSKPTGFHVRHDFQPDLARELLLLLRAASTEIDEGWLHSAAEERGYRLRQRKEYSKLLSSLADLDLLLRDKENLRLTRAGQVLADVVRLQPETLAEYIHFLYYTAYSADQTKRFSWSYRLVCETLWENAPAQINRDRLVGMVSQLAAETFETDTVSFSVSSVGGILSWLEQLTPAVFTEREDVRYFTRRPYCPIETFFLAINHWYDQLRNRETVYVPLTDDFRLAVCRLCLLMPEAFDEMLVQTEAAFSVLQVRRERGERLAITQFDWTMLQG